MLFNTPIFLIFLLIVIPVYCVLPKMARKYFILIVSYIFYGYWDWRFCGLLLLSTVMDYYLGQWIANSADEKRRRSMLHLSIAINLTLLGFFKYFNFFLETFQKIPGVHLDQLHIHILLPVGISFYTFQSLSYTFDIYRRKLEPAKSIFDYALFVSFFPQLVAGPIEKAIDLLPQVIKSPTPTKENIKEGIALITIGMFKKVLIGDTCSKYVDHLFTEPNYYSSSEMLCALFLFAIQIYADFSGYSKIAKGCGKLLGVNLIDNFNQPYLSSNITDFWRRWHISLSDWLKDYVYIWWLGGNRKGKKRTYFNLMATMLIGGFWHGASWTFVIWGGIHGSALAIHKFILGDKKPQTEYTYRGIPSFVKYLLNAIFTFLIVVLAWLFFRAQNFDTIKIFFSKMTHWTSSDVIVDMLEIAAAFYIVSTVMDVIEYRTKNHAFTLLLKPAVRYGVYITVWTVIIMYMYTVIKPMPFIYFQF